MVRIFTRCPIRSIVLFLVISSILSINAFSQAETSYNGEINMDLDSTKRKQIVETVVKTMQDYYISTAKADEMTELLQKNLRDGVYDEFDKRDPFIKRLTKDLRSVTNDRHLGVWPIEWSLTLDEISEEAKAKEAAFKRYSNFGLPSVKRLHGNIGYLEILDFEDSPEATSATIAAMNFLAGCDALIIDLRRCGGGEGYGVGLILSYFFEEPTHYASFYTRHNNEAVQSWSMPFVQGPKLVDVPVYILQSRRTASAAESMSYSLQALKRATIVGEKSRGAANPVDELNFPDLSICVAVSISEVSSPVTGTGWEGVGIEPDINTLAETALPAACRDVMEKLLQQDADEDIKRLRQWALDMYEAELNPAKFDESEVKHLCGDYSSSVSVWEEGGELYMRRADGEPAVTLVPVGKDEFAVKEREARARFKRDADGTITELVFIYASGYDYTFKRLEN
jgi:hypothetical protein